MANVKVLSYIYKAVSEDIFPLTNCKYDCFNVYEVSFTMRPGLQKIS